MVPNALTRGPVTLDEARRHGLDRWHLHGRRWRRVGPATYVQSGVADTPELRLAAASRRLPPGAAFSGLAAAWLHGLTGDLPEPIEVTVPANVTVSARVGMKVRRCGLEREDVVRVGGLPVTSVARTLRDVCIRTPLVEAVVLVDAALHARLISLAALRSAAAAATGKQGVQLLRRAIDHAEPKAESPMETRMRMILVLSGLPRPEAQVTIRDGLLRFCGRVDLYYPQAKLAIEYDGATHKDSIAEDNRRHNRLVHAGVRVLRFTAADLYNTPELVVSRVRAALAA